MVNLAAMEVNIKYGESSCNGMKVMGNLKIQDGGGRHVGVRHGGRHGRHFKFTL